MALTNQPIGYVYPSLKVYLEGTMVVFLDASDNLITTVPPGKVYVQKFGLSGFHFMVSMNSTVVKWIHKTKTDTGPSINDLNNLQFPPSVASPSNNIQDSGSTESADFLRYDFAVAHFSNILDSSGNPHGATFVDTLNALCAFLNFERSLGEVNTASNVGTGAGVFKQKVGVDLEMRSISSSDFDVTEGADEVQIEADPALISNKSTVTAAAGMNALVEDSGNLRKVDVNDFLGGGASFGFDKTKNAFYFPGTNRVDYAYRTNGTVSINQLNVIGFNIYGQVELESLSINATSALVANVVASIYKYDYATNNWNLVAQSTPYTTGISGLQTYTLPSTVTMENGLYFAGLLGDVNAANLSGVQANGLYNAFGYATTPLNLAAVDKWFKYNLTYTATMPATISGYPTGFIRQTSGNVGLPLLKFN